MSIPYVYTLEVEDTAEKELGIYPAKYIYIVNCMQYLRALVHN